MATVAGRTATGVTVAEAEILRSATEILDSAMAHPPSVDHAVAVDSVVVVLAAEAVQAAAVVVIHAAGTNYKTIFL
jgi:hypothetical protein